jgi:hypothetical protein
MRHWGPKRAQQHIPDFAQAIVAEVGACFAVAVRMRCMACWHDTLATGAAASWQCAACRWLTLMLLQAKRSLLLRLPHLLQYNQKGAISERAAMKGPMPGKKL